MIYTLTLCIGMFLSICGSIKQFDFPDHDSCAREREAQRAFVGSGYAVCAPKQQKTGA